jgi:hypothetical protein
MRVLYEQSVAPPTFFRRSIGNPVQLSLTPIGDPVQLFRDPPELHPGKSVVPPTFFRRLHR